MIMPRGPRFTFEERIAHSTRRAANGCLEWARKLHGDGYPRMTIAKKTYKASRLVWAYANGPIPEGLVIRHTCDNPACVCINHLELGTRKDNTQDMLKRKRAAIGERAGASKLTEAQARRVKYSKEPRKILASELAISHSQIDRIRSGENWAHI